MSLSEKIHLSKLRLSRNLLWHLWKHESEFNVSSALNVVIRVDTIYRFQVFALVTSTVHINTFGERLCLQKLLFLFCFILFLFYQPIEVSGCELHSVECFNGGACEPIGTGYKCNCQEGYIGRHCGKANVIVLRCKIKGSVLALKWGSVRWVKDDAYFVTAYTFCASRVTRVSYWWCLLIQGYFCAV